ncbi:MAG TPA: hypothetical protein VF384_08110 [Planctomycetota bacterium]
MLSRSSLLPWLLATAGLVSAWPQGQEPKPTPPAPAAAPAPAPAIAGKPPAHQLEGVYELRKRMANGQSDAQQIRGYLAITNRHMFLCIAGPGDDPDEPLVRSGVRAWKPDDDLMRCELKLGYYTDSRGDIHVERPGTLEVRRVELAGGRLRVFQDARSYLEFERIE